MMMKKIEMMEAKLWFALCALLLVNMGSADKAANTTTAHPTEPTKNGTSVIQLPSMSHAASNLSTEAETGTNATNATGTFSTSAPLHNAPTSSTPSNNSAPTFVSAPNDTMTAPNDTMTAPNDTMTARNDTIPASPTNATSSRDNATTSQPPTKANQSFKPSPVTTTALLNITSTHAESSPHLTIQGSKSHDSPGLDPLLVGLVSAFVITAIVITLLLFLKFRRRQSGPQFHRLQDLPMDDMMEDAPLSMYSY